MSHIAVERNRRRLMNEHLAALRSLMPPSYIQRGDQASIVGGAIDFVKELEQHLQSLQAEKQFQAVRSRSNDGNLNSQCPFDGFFTSPQYIMQKPSSSSTSSSSTSVMVDDEPDGGCGGTTSVANIEVMLIQTHVNLRILAPKRPGQLVRAIAAIEELHLTVLHLNVTSVDDSVLYSLNLKTEDECKLGSADEIATAVHRIFSYIDSITKCQQR
uniref:BHLH transcription factor n=1 Tax=Potamogeton wrightii TaxID=384654 RepID=A0A1C9ZYY0_9LILI|nr:bHLH transcription factor [Potamogeton wrightii]